MAEPTQPPLTIPPPEYFTSLAINYAHYTGNSTKHLFAQILSEIRPPITSTSVVHDNAAGPGTAASVLLAGTTPLPEKLMITDNSAAMIAVATETLVKGARARVEALVMSATILDMPSNHFTHSILNFSIFALDGPGAALREIYRTLGPGGTAVLLTWKRWPVIDMVHAVQRAIRPDLPLMRLPQPQYMEDGVLKAETIDAGFEKGKVRSSECGVVLQGEDLEGIGAFMKSSFMAPAMKGWSELDCGRFAMEMDGVFEREIEQFGGLKMEAWVVLAEK